MKETKFNAPPFEFDDSKVKKALVFGSAIALTATPSIEVVAEDNEAEEEIIVTAAKRESRIEDLPMSVQAITGSRLDDAGVNDFMDYAELIPTLSYIQYGPGRSAFYLRGTSDGNFGNLAGPNTTVAMYIDESPINTVGVNPDLHIYDMERIEVLNGPQGTLYGSSAQGGTVRLITNKPEQGNLDFGFEVDTSSGPNMERGDSRSFETFINAPITDKASVRISAYDVSEGGFIDLVGGTKTFTASNYSVPLLEKDNSNSSSVKGYRASLRTWLNDSLTATLTHTNQDSRTDGSWDHQPTTLGDLKSSKVIGEFTDDEWDQTSFTIEGDGLFGNQLTYAGTFFDRDVRYLWDYNDYVEYYNLDSPAQNGFGYYSYYTCDYYSYYYYGTWDGACNNPTMWADYSLNMERETHEFRVTSGTQEDSLQWIIGVFYDNLENPYQYTYKWPGMMGYYSDGTWGGTGTAGREGIWWDLDNLREDEVKAIYGEATFAISEKLRMTVGMRKFESKLRIVAKNGYFGGFGPSYYGHDNDRVEEDSGTAPKFALAYALDNGALLYMNYSEGYRPGGTNRINKNSDAAPLYYDADQLNNIEVGYKYLSEDSTLRYNLTFYSMSWKDMQTANFDLDLASISFNSNIGDAIIQGLEGDVTLTTKNGVNFIAGATILNPRLDEDYVLNGVTLANEGTRLANVPKIKGSIAINKDFDIKGLSGYWDLSLSRTGKRKSSMTNPIDQGAYTLGNFSTTIVSENWSAVFYVDNIFDTRATIWEYQGYRPETVFTNRPRTLGLRLKYKL